MCNSCKKTILALGTDIKNRILLAKGSSIRFGADIGDLSEVSNYELFKKEVRKALKRYKPNIIAFDLHPNYFSSLLAKAISYQPSAISYQPIQHHHAHIASVMYEHNLPGPVIGVSFDGTGYGEDGNSWGGEFLLVGKSGFKCLAHLKYRMLPGADKVVFEPWRMAVSILREKALTFLPGVKKIDKELVLKMLSKRINSPLSSSAGRLFDAAASLLGVCLYASHQAQGPIKLEAMCNPKINTSYGFSISRQNSCCVIDTDGLFLGMLNDLRYKRDKSIIATKFHNSLAEIIAETVKKLFKVYNVKKIALSGGVFQNNFLKTKAIKALTKLGFDVFTNIKTSVTDWNISLGQYYVSCSTGKS